MYIFIGFPNLTPSKREASMIIDQYTLACDKHFVTLYYTWSISLTVVDITEDWVALIASYKQKFHLKLERLVKKGPVVSLVSVDGHYHALMRSEWHLRSQTLWPPDFYQPPDSKGVDSFVLTIKLIKVHSALLLLRRPLVWTSCKCLRKRGSEDKVVLECTLCDGNFSSLALQSLQRISAKGEVIYGLSFQRVVNQLWTTCPALC